MIFQDRHKYPSVILFSLLGAGLLFLKSLAHDWTYDDTPVILANQDIRSLGNFLDNSYPGRPLRELSYLLDYKIWGLDPAGFAVQNIFWHGLCAGLIGCLLLLMRAPLIWALGGAALFLSHPLTVEVAANSAHRKDSLCLAFVLLSVIFHLTACRRKEAQARWLFASLAAFAVACLAKQHALLTPLVLLAVELFLVEKEQRVYTKRMPLLVSLAFAGLAYGVTWFFVYGGAQRFQTGAAILLQKFNYLDAPTVSVYCRMVGKALSFAAMKFVLPVDLAPEYTFTIPESFMDPWLIASGLLVVFYVIACIWCWRRRQALLTPLLWVGVFWLPVMNLWPLTYLVADRYLYTPLAGAVMVLTLALAELHRRRRWVSVLLLILLIGSSTLTWRQLDVWSSEKSLWTHVSKVNPFSATAFINLSVQAINVDRDFQKGLRLAQRAVSLNARHPVARKNLAVAYERLGQGREALQEYLRAYDLYRDKTHPEAQHIKRILARNYRVFLP